MEEIPQWAWTSFALTLLILLAIDLFSHREGRESTRKWAIVWCIVWIAAGMSFGVFIWIVIGRHAVDEYLAAYLIEESLSFDNMFVFLIIFKTLKIPKKNQRTALSWGIFGALVFRAIFIFAGTAAFHRWEWVSYVFGVILLYAAYHAFREDPTTETKESRVVSWLSARLPISRDTNDRRFFIKYRGKRKATPLFVAILALELSDILFAVDSVPAAFSITRTTFIIYTSNAFAILGLRSLYIVIAELIGEMHYLHYGLAGILAFAGLKLTFSQWVHITPIHSVLIIIATLAVSVCASLWIKGRPER